MGKENSPHIHTATDSLDNQTDHLDTLKFRFSRLTFEISGYGHIAPATTLGRLITIVYSLFGIPLFLILLADYGKLFTRVIKFFWAYVRKLYYTGSCCKVQNTASVQVRILLTSPSLFHTLSLALLIYIFQVPVIYNELSGSCQRYTTCI